MSPRLTADWTFEPVGPMGGATGTAFANTLQAGGIAPEAELAREAIQNSCDAAVEGNRRVSVAFRFVTLEGEHKHQFLEALSLERSIGKRLDSLSLPPDNCLTERSQSLCLLYIEDYGTVGLRGDPHDRQSNFHRLLLSVGDTDKTTRGTLSGGSYGYGKAALSMNSRLRTIVAYSVFEQRQRGAGAPACLMACTYLDAHEFEGKQWSGRAWFGIRQKGEVIVVDPLRDQEAHALAEKLGFRVRKGEAYGTSILIVDSYLRDSDRLLRAIEEWWWPRLIDEELEVIVADRGVERFPRPKQREDLLPFIECYSLAVGRAEPVGSYQRCNKFNRLRNLALGSYGFQLLPSDRAEKCGEDKIGTVALIRSPKMVVEYARLGGPMPPTVGVFLADKEIDEILKLAEPPNHDRWDPEAPRLELAKPDEKTAREVVRQVSSRLKSQIRRFQSEATPPRRQEDRRLEFLERQLGMLFKAPLRDSNGPEGRTGPIEIRFREGPATRPSGSGRIETTAKVAMRVRDEWERDELDAILRVRIPLLEDDIGREGDLLLATVESDDPDLTRMEGTEPEIAVTLKKHEWTTVLVRSAPYDAGWSARIDIEVIPE